MASGYGAFPYGMAPSHLSCVCLLQLTRVQPYLRLCFIHISKIHKNQKCDENLHKCANPVSVVNSKLASSRKCKTLVAHLVAGIGVDVIRFSSVLWV